MKTKTTIQITERVWIKLNSMKKIGENFNDVLIKLLSFDNECNDLNNIKN